MTLRTQVLIVGGGITGTGIARDLALRGVRAVLIERRQINAGASGANHGVLHSGARYISTDPESSRECMEENELLKRMAPHCIEDTGGLYVAVPADDQKYLADFPGLCAKSGVPCHPLDVREAREMEPVLSRDVVAAYRTEDACIDPFRVSFENMAQALKLGHLYLPHTGLESFEISGKRIRSVTVKDTRTGEEQRIEADQVVNAAGAWVGQVAAIAGASIGILYSKGTLLVTNSRLAGRLLLRLRPPSDGDVLCPGGTVSILGPSSVRLESPDGIKPTAAEVGRIIAEGIPIAPSLENCRFIRAFSGVRPLIAKKKSAKSSDDRKVSRGYDLIDHTEDGVENFLTVAGGKLSIFRLMAEKTADLVCRRLGVDAPCLTRTEPLPATLDCAWTEPGLAPKVWLDNRRPEDLLLCECEMVPRSTVDALTEADPTIDKSALLQEVGLRSRVGKGACQGMYCGLRVTAHFYDRGAFDGQDGYASLRQFAESRWKGQRPILFGEQLRQAELQEALYCGLFDLDLSNPSNIPGGDK